MAWTVNNNREKDDFRQRMIPFFTDSPVQERPEAWVPPERRINNTRVMLLVLLVSVPLVVSLML